MCQILGIEKTRTTHYRPQSDGMIERANRTIETMLGTFVDQNQQNWDELVPFLMMANRSSVQIVPLYMSLQKSVLPKWSLDVPSISPLVFSYIKETYSSE